jgi:hypothetical protein
MTEATVHNWDKEHVAVRMFLMYYATGECPVVGDMRENMENVGYRNHPDWVVQAPYTQTLTKAGAQSWIKFLLTAYPEDVEE